jgi:dTDP-4-amino-4,6-dideoxygalactose transaminase
MTVRPSLRSLPLVDLAAQHALLRDELDAAVASVFESGQFVLGPEVSAFEEEFAGFCGANHAVACANGTDALELSLQALGIGEGAEVITVANTFAATAEAIVRVGARPRFVDVEPGTLLMDLDAVEKAIGPDTRAIMPVHLFGSCVDMDRVMRIASRHDLLVVEDAAQAHGATSGERRAGVSADAGCFSFYPGKNLGACGDAGCVVTGSAEVAERLRRLRDHGSPRKYEHLVVGRNSRMDGIQAAILRVKLRRLDTWNRRRRELAERYVAGLATIQAVRCVSVPVHGLEVRHLMVVEVPDRDALQRALSAEGCATGVHYPVPLHLQPAFAEYAGEALPMTEAAAGRILSLPLYPELTEDAVDWVLGIVRRALGQ